MQYITLPSGASLRRAQRLFIYAHPGRDVVVPGPCSGYSDRNLVRETLSRLHCSQTTMIAASYSRRVH